MSYNQPLQRIVVFVAESSPISSQLLAEAIAKDPRVDVLGFSSEPLQVIQTILRCYPDVLVISERMEEEPNRGLCLLQQLRTKQAAMKAIVLLDSSRPDAVVNAFRSGASGVFCRTAAVHMLCRSIAAVASGQVWANSEELGFILSALAVFPSFQVARCDGLALLSKREIDVVQCLAEGQTNRQIAATLRISPHTVKNYMFKIFEKMGVSNRVELAFCVLSRLQNSAQAQAFQGDSSMGLESK